MNLPVFVYGTLRNSLHNYSAILDGNTTKEIPATLSGGIMRSNGGFPYVTLTDDTTHTIVGELMYLNETNAEETMRNLDWLEGFNGDHHPHNHYDRILVKVETAEGTTQAWTYIAGNNEHIEHLPIVTSGDWNARETLAHTSR